jgi:hypothetical protein
MSSATELRPCAALVRVAHKWQIMQRVACFQPQWTPQQAPA